MTGVEPRAGPRAGEIDPAPGERLAEPKSAVHLLFVCTGNTCRSPLATALAEQVLSDLGWTSVSVRSAGVAVQPGGPASEGSIRAAARHGLDLQSHRATQLTPELVDWADLILTMSPGHLVGVDLLGGRRKAELITDFALGCAPDELGGSPGVTDPIGGDDRRYEETYRELSVLVERAIALLASS